MDPQTTSHYDLHPFSALLNFRSDLQPPAHLLLTLGAHLSVRLSGRGSDCSLSGLHLPCSGPPQQCIQGPGPLRQPLVASSPANAHLLSSPSRPSLPLSLSAICLSRIHNAATFPVKGGDSWELDVDNATNLLSYLLFFVSQCRRHGSSAGGRPVAGLQDSKWSLQLSQRIRHHGTNPDSETCYNGITQSQAKLCDWREQQDASSPLSFASKAAASSHGFPSAAPPSEGLC